MTPAPLTELQDSLFQVSLRIYCDAGDAADEDEDRQARLRAVLDGEPDPEPGTPLSHYRAVLHVKVPSRSMPDVRRAHFDPPLTGKVQCHCAGTMSRSIVFRRIPVDLRDGAC